MAHRLLASGGDILHQNEAKEKLNGIYLAVAVRVCFVGGDV